MFGGLVNTSLGLAELLAAAWLCGCSLTHSHPGWGCAACGMETPKPSPDAGVTPWEKPRPGRESSYKFSTKTQGIEAKKPSQGRVAQQ